MSSSDASVVKDTSTKFRTETGKRISQIAFWTVFLTSIVLSIQIIFPSISYYREIAIAEFGDTAQASAWVWTTFFFRNLIRIIFLSVGTLIYFRKPDERISVITGIFLLSFGSAGIIYAQYVPDTYAYSVENFLHLQYPISFVAWLILFIYFVYFPDGRPIPRIAMLHIIPAAFMDFSFYLPQDSAWYPLNWSPILLVAIMIVLLGVPLTAQIYRYRNISTQLQRQQTKIVIIGFVAASVSIVTAVLITGDAETGSVGQINMSTFGDGGFVLIPIMLAIAMLRYRLWDIDSIINRLLGYAVIAVIGIVLFVVFLFGINAVLDVFQPLVAALIATKITGLLFQPVHGRVQKLIDRHIYNLRFSIDELRAAHRRREIENPGALSGQTLGNYEVLDVLGKGGMGEVYKVTDGKDYKAIKTLLTNKTPEPELIARFKREGEIGQRLNHSNIAHVYDIAEDNGTLYMVMDYYDGEDLGTWLKREDKLDHETVREIVRDLTSALDVAHREGMVHRDIKPANIMMMLNDDNETHRAILMDFGISKLKDANTLTGTGAIGTIDYMSPEQILEAKSVELYADIYALGILTFRMLTGELPFKGGAGQVMFAHIQQPAPDPRDIDETVPRQMAKAIMRALEKDPLYRFDSATAFAGAFCEK